MLRNCSLFLLYASLIHFGGESCRLMGKNIINPLRITIVISWVRFLLTYNTSNTVTIRSPLQISYRNLPPAKATKNVSVLDILKLIVGSGSCKIIIIMIIITIHVMINIENTCTKVWMFTVI